MDIAQRLVSYCEDVLNGKIKVCKKHLQAIKRFMRDLEKSQNDDYPYYFDIEEVENFYEFAKLFKHSKGILAGQPIYLVDFQLFIVANIFGWKHKQTHYRRFKKAYIQLARKNAKSQLLSIMASYECFLSGQQAEVYIAGWGREQSNIVYKEILKQLKGCALLQDKYSDSYHRITHLKSDSIIMALSREGKKLDGLNPSLAIIDEWHCHPTSEIYDVLISGMVRPNAIIVTITTAGFDLNAPCYTDYKYVAKLLDENNPIENEEFFALVTEMEKEDLNDLTNESLWIKANPLLCSFQEGIDFLRGEVKQMLDMPEKQRNVKTKNFNVWLQDKIDGYLNLERYNNQVDEKLTLKDMKGKKAIVGVDLSSTLDLTSVGFIFYEEETDTVQVFGHSFIPYERLEEKRKTDRVPYDLWTQQGFITCTSGSAVDYDEVEQWIIAQEQKYGFVIQEIASDPWNSSQFLSNFEKKGYTVVEIPQRINHLAHPTKDFRERVYKQKLVAAYNPVLAWAIGNAVTKLDHNLNMMLDKSKATERIDPIASVINAMARLGVLINKEADLNELISSDDWSL